MDDSHRGVVGASVVVGFLLVLFCAQSAWLGARFALDLGTSGTYVIGEGFYCSKRAGVGCHSPHGTFTSHDGKVRREDVRLNTDLQPHLGQGDVVPAYDVDEPKTVYRAGEPNYEGIAFLTLWGAGAVVFVMGTGYLWLTRKRT
ncbi:hypothetical protein GCM10011609_65750 [Lentzea pudingi]|uniref:DUF3592 domain-containing protein n=1 Tax=Lentzea pudingi TaxID=1789439 RepID=A0ABQ2IM19_9PSEU|nr:hypothetical protein [Lentzea pudingi]GGN15936.1 hypothetical protein GCM10011609_65750 [Lentzea pudingi]